MFIGCLRKTLCREEKIMVEIFLFLIFLCVIGYVLSLLISGGIIRSFHLFKGFHLRQIVDGFLITLPKALLSIINQPKLPLPPIMMVVFFGFGLYIFLKGLELFVSATRQLGIMAYRDSSSIPKEKKRLITDGAYGIIRHPMYLGDLLWPIGLSIMLHASWALLLTPLWFAFVLALTFVEEKNLEEFREEYKEYKKRVPRIIPIKRLTKTRLKNRESKP
jgi:protein-S-isoprenylcysteine O-methyltransferase Ste14